MNGAEANVELFCDDPRLNALSEPLQTITFALRKRPQIAWYARTKDADRDIGRFEWPHPPSKVFAISENDFKLPAFAYRNHLSQSEFGLLHGLRRQVFPDIFANFDLQITAAGPSKTPTPIAKHYKNVGETSQPSSIGRQCLRFLDVGRFIVDESIFESGFDGFIRRDRHWSKPRRLRQLRFALDYRVTKVVTIQPTSAVPLERSQAPNWIHRLGSINSERTVAPLPRTKSARSDDNTLP